MVNLQNIPAIKYTWADLLLSYLAQIEVAYIFGVPGGAIEPLYDAMARCQQQNGPGPKPIVARHEAGAAYMAEGYARETGKLGVCCATTGPGATNLITGIASAYTEKIPVLVITAQTAIPQFGKLGLQESSGDAIDTVGMFSHCTRYNSLISHEDQFEGKIISALMSAYRHPRGPVHLSIPMDLFRLPVTTSATIQLEPLLREPYAMDQRSLDELCKAMLNARKLVFFLGHGSKSAIDWIIRFAELFNATIVSTPQGKSWISGYHPLYRGVFGFAGHGSARAALSDPEVDQIIAVGTSLGELSTSGWDELLLNNKLIHIEASLENFTRSPMAKLHIFGNLECIFSTLVERAQQAIADRRFCPNLSTTPLPPPNHQVCTPSQIQLQDPAKYLECAIPIKPQRLICELAHRCPDNIRFVIDAGNSWAWATHYLHLRKGKQYHVGMGFGAMAWAIGAAVGVALARRDMPVVCITGDGSFLMSGQELTVAVAEQLCIIFVVLNDQALGMVKHGQRLGGGEPIGYALPPVNFAQMAEAMGAKAYSIHSPEDFAQLDLSECCRRQAPILLDVHIDPEEIPPMGVRMKTLKREL